MLLADVRSQESNAGLKPFHPLIEFPLILKDLLECDTRWQVLVVALGLVYTSIVLQVNHRHISRGISLHFPLLDMPHSRDLQGHSQHAALQLSHMYMSRGA